MVTTERRPDKILDFCDLNLTESHDAELGYLGHLAFRYTQTGLGEIPPVEPDGVLQVFVNCGRWMARCPTCNTSVIACIHLGIFMCPGCGNSANDDKWLHLAWPGGFEDIEALLLAVPGFRANAPGRWWYPGKVVNYDLAN